MTRANWEGFWTEGGQGEKEAANLDDCSPSKETGEEGVFGKGKAIVKKAVRAGAEAGI